MKRKIINILTLLLFVLPIGVLSIACGASEDSANVQSSVAQIEDVEQYSRISAEDLISLLGEPNSTDAWTLSTAKGDFAVETLSYEKDCRHYEFIIADDAVIRLSIYSSKYWTNEGSAFSYSKDIQEACSLFGVNIGDTTKKSVDNGFSYILSPVNDKVAEFDVQNIDKDSKTFDFVKVTYNLNYFN